MRKTIIGAALVASLLSAAPALASVTDSPTDAQYNPPNIPSEPAPPPQDTIGILPFTGNEIDRAGARGHRPGRHRPADAAGGRQAPRGRTTRKRLLREREEAGWSPRMDWNWPVRKSGLVETDRDSDIGRMD